MQAHTDRTSQPQTDSATSTTTAANTNTDGDDAFADADAEMEAIFAPPVAAVQKPAGGTAGVATVEQWLDWSVSKAAHADVALTWLVQIAGTLFGADAGQPISRDGSSNYRATYR